MLRVEKIVRGNLKDKFNFKFKRRDLVLFRTSDEMCELREELC